jgi:hypothetical protein
MKILTSILLFLGLTTAAMAQNPTAIYGPANTNQANIFTKPQTAPAFFRPIITAGPLVNEFDDLIGTATNWNSGSIGSPTGASWGSTTTNNTVNHPGVSVALSGTGGTGTGEYTRYGSQYFLTTPNGSSPTWTMEFMVFPGQLPGTTVGEVQAGMTNSFPPVSPTTTGLAFVLSSASGVPNDWYCANGSNAQIDSTIAATLAWTRLDIQNDGSYIHYYVNGAEATACKVAIASAVSTSQEPIVTAKALSATGVAIYIDYFAFQDNVMR